MNTLLHSIAVAMLLACCRCAPAATISVTSTADSGAGSLRQALAVANDGDTIDATGISGVITLTTGHLLVDKSVTINGPGAGVLAVDGNAASVVFFIFRNLPGETVIISGLTIRNGTGDFGAGIENEETLTITNSIISGNMGLELGGGIGNAGTATITNTIISGNSAIEGAGIYSPGITTVTNSTISGNMATTTGGACTTADGTLEITNSTLSNNSADVGGAIENGGGTVTLTNTIVSGNSARDGGGVYIGHGLTMNGITIVNSTLSNNTAARGGGAFNVGTLEVTNSTVSGNTSTGDTAGDGGGAGYNAGTLNIVSSTISGNMANREGGGIYNSEESALTISNSTFSGNVASLSGGAIFNLATLQLANSTLSDNSAPFLAGGIINFGPLQIGNTILNAGASGVNLYVNGSGTVTSLGYNISSDDAGGFLTGPGDQLFTNPMLGPLQNNGGPTFTHALLPGSPAIDAGDPKFTPPPFFDQRGPGFDRVVNGRIDKGSFEVQALTVQSASSRKTHDAAGTFDIPLPLTGNVGVECRSGGTSNVYQMIINFMTNVTVGS
ncbi:MAG: choice-of-anchor Q domain-containing protein, partial [Chthoniobacterales bacterium]